MHIPHQRDSEADRCHDLLAGPYKHVAGLVGVDPAPLAPRPWFEDGVHLELPARLVFIAVVTAFLTRAQPQVAVLKVREGELAEPVLASADLCHIAVLNSLCAPLEGPFLYDQLLFDVAALPASLYRDPLSGRLAPVLLLHVKVSHGAFLRPSGPNLIL